MTSDNRKRIFIAIHYLELGGAEMSLIGLLHALDYSRYEVDLMVYSHRGELMEMIPKEVNVLPEISEYAQIERPMSEVLKSGYWRIVLARLKAKWQYHLYARRTHPDEGSAIFQYVDDAVCPFLPTLHHLGEYDLAISYVTPHRIVAEKVLAKCKAAWIHTDYSYIDTDVERELPVWSRYDHIVSISKDVTTSFCKKFPTLGSRIEELHNILSPSFVRQRAEVISNEELENEMPRTEGVVNLLSVGRFSHAKNYDNIPTICRMTNDLLKEKSCGVREVRWYIIGYGGGETLIRQRIAEEGMEGQVRILGKRANPYPYIRACDIYAQPSRFEGRSVTVREAQVLCKPVVVTRYATAGSQINDGVDGVIVGMDNEACAKGIAALVTDKALQQRLKEYLSCHDYGDEKEAEKIDLLFE